MYDNSKNVVCVTAASPAGKKGFFSAAVTQAKKAKA